MRFLLIDANSIINRAFYGIRHLSTKDGRNTNAIYGFLATLNKLNEDIQPDGIVCAFDLKGPTVRHEMYDDYKAGRKRMPDELAEQFDPLKEILGYMGIDVVSKKGYEADDIIGTLANACEEQGTKCYIATGDRDAFQLVSEKTTLLLSTTKRGQPETIIYTPEKLKEEYNLTPEQMLDLKGLMGDSSDNIPGVPGVGEKTALMLLDKYENYDNIFDDIASLDVTPAVKRRLEDGKESAFLSKDLGTIIKDVPIDTNMEDYKLAKPDKNALAVALADLELFSWLEKFKLEKEEIGEESKQSPALKFNFKDSIQIPEIIKSNEKLNILFEKDEKHTFAHISGKDALAYVEIETDVFADVENALADEKKEKRVENLKEITKNLKGNKRPANVSIDTMLAGYLLNPLANDYSVSRLSKEYAVVLPEVSGEYNGDVALLSVVADVLEKELEKNNQAQLLHDIEIPLSVVLAEMELTGFAFDSKGLKEYGEILQDRITDLERHIINLVGYEFNLNSPKQLSVALFEDLKLPPKKKTKTGYSTNAEVLESLRQEHEVIDMILDYRTLAKLNSTYCDGLLKVVDEDGRIRTSFNQVETRTGRISSVEPNLQNIPVRSEVGRELRKFFIAQDGWVLCDADYSQIELRVLAHMSQDKTMMDAFKSGVDIHSVTASQVFGIEQSNVTPLMRFRAKAVNFGIIYGIGPHSLSKDISVSYKEAKNYIDEYLKHYKSVSSFMDEMIKEAKDKGYAETIYGRRRPLPEITASNAISRSFGERVARNMPIQGTAADIIKIAMINVRNRLKKEGMRSRLILQVHDELIVEAPENEAEKAAKLLREEMEKAVKLTVPLEVDVSIGKTWYDAKG